MSKFVDIDALAPCPNSTLYTHRPSFNSHHFNIIHLYASKYFDNIWPRVEYRNLFHLCFLFNLLVLHCNNCEDYSPGSLHHYMPSRDRDLRGEPQRTETMSSDGNIMMLQCFSGLMIMINHELFVYCQYLMTLCCLTSWWQPQLSNVGLGSLSGAGQLVALAGNLES